MRGRHRWVLTAAFTLSCKAAPIVDTDTDVATPPTDTGVEDTAPPPPPPPPVWVAVSTHPCALATDGLVRCWTSPSAEAAGVHEHIPETDFPVQSFWAPGYVSLAVAVGAAPDAGTLTAWHCPRDPDPITGELPPICRPPQNLSFRTTGLQVGWTTAGDLVTWREGVVEPVAGCPTDKTWSAFAALTGSVYAMATDGTACVADSGGLGPHFLGALSTPTQVTEVAPGGNGICGLNGLSGGIQCVGPESEQYGFNDPLVFANGPYVDLAGGVFGTCAVRADWTIECNDGSTHDFGPIRDLSVNNMAAYDLTTGDTLYTAQPRQGLNLCVITTTNAIRCVGDRYYPDLLDQLPAGDVP